MPASATSRLARLRANATGESHQKAYQAIESVPPANPILAEPFPMQEQLEGAIFDKMHTLRFIPAERDGSFFKPFGIRRVIPSPDQLLIELEGGSSYDEFVRNIMPVIEQVEDYSTPEIHGVPGLRRRPHDAGLGLFRPGVTGEVIIAGVDVEDWEAAHAAGFSGPHSAICPATSHPAQWTPEEQNYASSFLAQFGELAVKHDHDDLILQCAMLRRIGLLNRLGSRSTSTWRKAGKPGVVVELFQNDYNFESHDRFIEEMTSPRMSPQLTCVYRRVSRNDRYRIIEFTTPRSEGSLEIRLRAA